MEAKESILALERGRFPKRYLWTEGLSAATTSRTTDVALYMEKNDEIIERKRKLFED